jgi:hypothetical protein
MKRGGCLKVAVLVIAVPIVFGLGLLLVSNVNRVLSHETTQAVIVDLVFSTDSDGDAAYTPVYEYTVNGNTYLYTGAISYSGAIVPTIGDRATILYDPDNPADARVRNVFLLIWLPILLMLLPILIAAGIFWSIRRRRRMAGPQPPPWVGDQARSAEDDPAGGRERITADFMGAEPSPMDDQGRVRYRVKARAEIGDTMHRFVSEWMDEDPTLHYMQHGNTVEVWMDPEDPDSYEVVLPAE